MSAASEQAARAARVEVGPLTPADLPGAAALHMAAFAGSMNTRIGPGYVRAFLAWFAARPEGIALAARSDGRPVGYVVGAPLGYGSRMNRDLLVPAAFGILTHPWVLLRGDVLATLADRARVLLPGRAPAEETGPDLPRPAMSLVGIAVDPAAQGLGVAGRLMARFEELSRQAGMRAMRLSVYPGNRGARHVYERAGWREHAVPGARTLYYWRSL